MIKHNLSTFIPQGCVSSVDPLQEAKNIIGELSDIYKFKKTIELDLSKEMIYERFVQVLQEKYKLENFSFYEINSNNDTMQLIYDVADSKSCKIQQNMKNRPAHLCRAFRTQSEVISSDFINLCQECEHYSQEYICIAFTVNEEFSLALNLHAKESTQLTKINSYIASIKNYLEAAKPVIESKLLMDKLRENSLKDAMTGLYNRRFLEEFIESFAHQVKRENENYSILMLDIDFFKLVNDTYGHDVGDKVIIAIGKVLKENIRESDLAIRYGGEEFLVMLHNANEEGTIQVAQKIHTAFANTVFNVGEDKTIQKTLSIGISIFPKDADTIWQCIKLADTALYIAKTTGRDKIVRYKKEMSDSEDLD